MKFGPKKRLGNEFSRLSQLQASRWKVSRTSSGPEAPAFVQAAKPQQARAARCPRAYGRLFRWWVGLGCVAFVAFTAIFYLMVAKQVPRFF
jgi:hypothetical protein